MKGKSRIIRLKATALGLVLLMCTMLMPSFAFAEDSNADSAQGNEVEATAEETEDAAEIPQITENPAPVEESAENNQEADQQEEPIEEELSADEAAVIDTGELEAPADELYLNAALSAGITPDSSNAIGVVVEAAESNIILHIGNVGTSGKAQIYSYSAENYYTTDDLNGLGTTADGTLVAEYDCGTSVDVECERYTADGADHLYDKYYIIQNDAILAGPFYASEIASVDNKNVTSFEVRSKKGLTHEDSSSVDKAIEFGTGNTVINLDIGKMIYANEDANGNPIDNSGKNAIKFTTNGETFYFSADYVASKDRQISPYTSNGINVSLVLISWVKSLGSSYPSSLLYPTNGTDVQTLGFNTSNPLGRKYWVAAMEFLANRYSDKDSCFVDQFIIGNEVDFAYDWYLIQPGKVDGQYQKADFNTFMEEYARTIRLANLAVKKYNSGAKVLLSLTHNWAENNLISYGFPPDNKTTARYNTYAPKDMVDWMVEHEGDRGDYNWGLSVHPYPIVTTSSNPVKTDLDPALGKTPNAHPITGDADTTPFITAVNLEAYQIYLERPVNQYKGTTRTVSITEGSICSSNKAKVSPEEYERSTMEQAASIAMMYYRAACVPCIKGIAYFEYHDQNTDGNYQLGLAETDGTEKPSADVWKYVDTNLSFIYTDRFLKYIDPDAKSYRDLMDVTNSGYNWSKYWIDENLEPQEADPSEAPNTDATRIYGETRYDTGIKSADAYKEQLGVDKFESVVLACGTNFADALAGSYLANVRKAPILLVDNTQNHINLAQEYIKKNLKSGGTIYILGGTAVVPDAAIAGLSEYTAIRLGGKDRYDTNIRILQEAAKYAGEEKEYLVASGNGFADSLSASATGKPIILVKDTIQDNQEDFINSLKGKRFYVIGGTGAVNNNMEKVFAKLGRTTRIGGATRYETSTNVARTFFSKPSCVVLAYGENFPDGLCGGPLAHSMNGPLILVANGKTEAANAYTDALGIYCGDILGGPTLINDDGARAILGLPTDTVIN